MKRISDNNMSKNLFYFQGPAYSVHAHRNTLLTLNCLGLLKLQDTQHSSSYIKSHTSRNRHTHPFELGYKYSGNYTGIFRVYQVKTEINKI